MSQKAEKFARRLNDRVDRMEQTVSGWDEALREVQWRELRETRAEWAADRRALRKAEAAARSWKTTAHAALIAAIAVLVLALVAVRAGAVEPERTEEAAERTGTELPAAETAAERMDFSGRQEPRREREDPEATEYATWMAEANVLEDCEVTWYTEDTCGKTPEHPAYGITASGLPVMEGVTCAVDPQVIPLYSRVFVVHMDGSVESLWATDTGVDGSAVDIYTPDYDYAIQCGRQRLTVYWLPAGEAGL